MSTPGAVASFWGSQAEVGGQVALHEGQQADVVAVHHLLAAAQVPQHLLDLVGGLALRRDVSSVLGSEAKALSPEGQQSVHHFLAALLYEAGTTVCGLTKIQGISSWV